MTVAASIRGFPARGGASSAPNLAEGFRFSITRRERAAEALAAYVICGLRAGRSLPCVLDDEWVRAQMDGHPELADDLACHQHVREAPSPSPVVLCYEGSDAARRAIRQAGRVLGGGPAVVVHVWELVNGATMYRTAGNPIVVPMLRRLVSDLNAEAEEAAQQIAAEGALVARGAGFQPEELTLPVRGSIWETIVGVAEEQNARAIVLGARPRSRARALFGTSVSRAARRGCCQPTLIVPAVGEPYWVRPQQRLYGEDARPMAEAPRRGSRARSLLQDPQRNGGKRS